ncbi:MAG: NAD(P)/FAD-dependent oxidoreductase [Acidimicrobiia bacterium]
MASVIVVGAGISGLGAAWELQKAGVDVSVLEAGDVVGGRMQSTRFHGAWIDRGAEFITSVDDNFDVLARELGMGDDKVPYPTPSGKVEFHIWRNGRAHHLSYTEPASFLTFGGMGILGKLRLPKLVPTLAKQMRRNGDEPFEPWRAAWCDDESVETWLSRLDPELLEYVVEPCFELFCGYEPHDFGKGAFVYLTTMFQETEIFTFTEGLGQLTRTLASKLDVTTGARVGRIDPCGGTDGRVVVDVEVDGQSERREADHVVVATQGTKVLGMLEGLDDTRRHFFERVRYTPHELCFFKLSSPPPGDVPTDVFFPRREDPELLALGYDRAGTTPDVSFFRVSMRTAAIRRNLETSDDDWADEMLRQVGLRYPQIPPLVTDRKLTRWEDALPIFWPGYCRALDTFVHHTPMDNVSFAGDYLAASSTGASYRTGQRAAADTLSRIRC